MISTTDRAITYTTDGVQKEFAFPHALIEASHLSVTLDGNSASGFVTAVNTDRDTGATVTFAFAPTAGQTMRIFRTTPITQQVDYTAGNAFNAETHEDALDKLTLILQEYADDLDRSIKAPVGSTTQTRFDSTFYSKYLGFDASGNIVALDETVGSGSGSGTSNFDIANVSDVDVITTAADGTTTITIPDTKTAIFGALVIANAGGGVYTHNIKLPTPATTGQRAFVRIEFSTAHGALITLKDHNDTTLFRCTGERGQFKTDLRVVANGSTWVVEKSSRGDIGADQFHGATYVIPEDESIVPVVSELITAAADADPATIYINNMIQFLEGDFVEIPSRHRLVFGQNGGFSFFTDFTGGSMYAKIDCEVITASKDQAIFENAMPGTVFGNFGGQGRNASWWSSRVSLTAIAYPDNWVDIQSALSSADWETTFTSDTVTDWDNATDTITVADTSNFAEGDVVIFSGTLPPELVSGRPYAVINTTGGAGTSLSTFQVAHAWGTPALAWGAGGSLAATVSKAKSASGFNVFLAGEAYTIDRPLYWGGSGATLRGNNALITAIAGEWASDVIEVSTFAGGHAPMLILGETSGEDWSGLPCGAEDLTLNGAGIAGISGVGSYGHIPRRSALKNVSIKAVTRHYVGWSKSWSARNGSAAVNDSSYLDVSNFEFTEIATSGDAPIPLHTPGNRANFFNGSISGDSSKAILHGANIQGVTIRDVTWDDANGLVDFADDALYKRLHLDNVFGTPSPIGTISVTSVNTTTDVLTAVGHGFSNGDVIRHTGVGTFPTGITSGFAYVVVSATTDTFQVSSAPGGSALPITTDNGAFTVEQPGIIVRFKSTQTDAKFTGVSITASLNEVIVVDTGTHNRMATGGENRAVDTSRSADLVAWGSVGFSYVSNGVVHSRGLSLHDLGTQYVAGTHGDLSLFNFDTANGRSFAMKMTPPGTSTIRWKYISFENANSSFYNTLSDPEI